jgi:hypothetical protein
MLVLVEQLREGDISVPSIMRVCLKKDVNAVAGKILNSPGDGVRV